MKINEFIEEFKNKKIQNSKVDPDAVFNYIKKTLEVKEYIPFDDKRQIAEMIVEQNSTVKNGIVKIDSVGQFISFIIAMLVAHTNLEIDQTDPVADYNALSESGLLEPIIEQFQKSYSECEVILKMVVADALADNNLNVIVASFLDGILDKIDSIGDVFSGILDGVDLNGIFGKDLTEKDLSKLKGFLDKYTI